MNQNKLTFHNNNLVVDYLRFILRGYWNMNDEPIESFEKWKDLVPYLLHQGFNIQIKSKTKLDEVSWSTNQHKVFFEQHKYRKTDLLLSFPGDSGLVFYENIVKTNKFKRIPIDLSCLKVTRVDIAYARKFFNKKEASSSTVKTYLRNCQDKVQQTSIKHTIIEATTSGWILKIGKRKSSPYYYRIYQKINQNSLRFELELKHRSMQKYQITKSFCEGKFSKMEHELTNFYFRKWNTFLDLHDNYSDWLIHFFRIKNVSKYQGNPLKISYLENFQTEPISLFQLKEKYLFLQMLWFLHQRAKIKQEILLLNQKYFIVDCPLRDLVKFIQPNFIRQDLRRQDLRYQLQQTKNILEKLQQ